MEKNTKIKFIHNIYSEADEDSPRQLLAKRGETGKFLNYTEWKYECEVETDDGFKFSCHENEFKII